MVLDNFSIPVGNPRYKFKFRIGEEEIDIDREKGRPSQNSAMGKKRKLRSNEPESSADAPLPDQLQLNTQTVPEQPEQQILIKSEPQIEEDQTYKPEVGLATVKMEEDAEEQPQNMNEDEEEEIEEEEEEMEEEGNDNGGQTSGNDADKGLAVTVDVAKSEEEEAESDEELEEEPIEKILEPFGKEQLVALVKEAVLKNPDLLESVNRLADLDPAHRKIFVHGLGWDSNKETLISVFSKYGEIEDCKAVCDKLSGKSKGYGFILFKHRSGAKKALKQPQKKIGNRLTSCQLSSAGPVPAPPPVGPPVSEYTQRKVFISNVSADMDPQKLTEFFARYGEIEEGPLGLDKQTGKFKGFCLFVYKSVESSRKALEEPHKTFEGKTLNIQKAVDGPKSTKPNFPQHQVHQQYHNQHHHQQQHHFSSRKEKTKYTSASGPTHGHLMAPSGPALGYNPAVAAPSLGPSIGQALTALLSSQGAGLGVSNLLGGFGATMNQGMPPPYNPGYANQVGASYGGSQPAYINQGGYQNPQLGQGSTRPASGGASYMGYGQ